MCEHVYKPATNYVSNDEIDALTVTSIMSIVLPFADVCPVNLSDTSFMELGNTMDTFMKPCKLWSGAADKTNRSRTCGIQSC